MGKIFPTEKVKLIAGLISNDEILFDKVKPILERRLRNPVDFESGIINFNYTDYYNEEMGSDLKRRFFSFKKLVGLENLAKIKLLTNDIEKKFSLCGKRIINIDPGYIDMAKLVLFSTKDYSHRVYTGKGIFAEVALHYKDKRFNSWPWTYPDYKSDEYAKIFGAIRDMYKNTKGV